MRGARRALSTPHLSAKPEGAEKATRHDLSATLTPP